MARAKPKTEAKKGKPAHGGERLEASSPGELKAKPKRKAPAKRRVPRVKKAIAKLAERAQQQAQETPERKKRHTGRPTEFPQDEFQCQLLVDRILELAEEGFSLCEISADIDIPRFTLLRWAEANEPFSDTLARAKELEMSWWEKKGRAGLENKAFNAHLWTKSMTARFRKDYSERSAVEMTGKDGKDLIPDKPIDDLELARRCAYHFEMARQARKAALTSEESKGNYHLDKAGSRYGM